MNDKTIHHLNEVELAHTPAFVFDAKQLGLDAKAALEAIDDPGCKLLFAMKSFSIISGLEEIAKHVDGFHASSLFEARLARSIVTDKGIVHLTSPGLRKDEIKELSGLCDYISFNSLSQWQSMRNLGLADANPGLRVNPALSVVEDERYDPCRHHSKLGIGLTQLTNLLEHSPDELAGISGLLVHSNCDATDFNPLLATVVHLEKHIAPLLDQLSWINLGGGYLLNQALDPEPLHRAIKILHRHNDIDILFEPGAALCRSAGYLVSEVLDVFESGGKQLAILDTTVNHMPEVFEYQFQPDVAGDSDAGEHSYLLVGCTCLAGDIFGEYAFSQPIQVGSRIIFTNAGAYTMVKAHMFNGINLPTIYTLTEANEAVLDKAFTYHDYLTHCGGR